MELLGPLKFKPLFKERIWGGSKISKIYKEEKGIPENCGEAWVLSGVEDDETEVAPGNLEENTINELVEVFMGELVGESVYEKFGEQFPILIKLLDANDYLSIQVHPNDELAQKRGMAGGKTEMWYVLEAEKDAKLIVGFNKKLDKNEYQKVLIEKKLPEVLNVEKVKKNDVFFIPAGRIHALGPGILLAEIQQTSDTTYRIYDWDRVDAKGKSRQLHIVESMDAIDFNLQKSYKTEYKSKLNDTVNLVDDTCFTTNIIEVDTLIRKNYEELDSFVIYLLIEGEVVVKESEYSILLKMGECLLLPALTTEVQIQPKGKAKILEVYIKI